MTTPDERANALLLSVLSDEQCKEFKKHGRFHVTVNSGRTYRITHGWAGNVYGLDEEGKVNESLCIHPKERIPNADNMLAQLLWLMNDEDDFREIANISDVRQQLVDYYDRREQYPARVFDDVFTWLQACVEGVRAGAEIQVMDDPRTLLIGFLVGEERLAVHIRTLRQYRTDVPEWAEPLMFQRREDLVHEIRRVAGIHDAALEEILTARFDPRGEVPEDDHHGRVQDIVRTYLRDDRGRQAIAESFLHPLRLLYDYYLVECNETPDQVKDRVHGRVRETLWEMLDQDDEVRDVLERMPWPGDCPPCTFEELLG